VRLIVSGQNGQIARALRESPISDVEILTFGRPNLDLENFENFDRLMQEARPDIFVNAAAYTMVDQAEQEEDLAMKINGVAAGALAQAAAAIDIPFIQISTDYVFDGAKATPYVETDAVAPINVYGRSKLAGELAVAAATPQHAILRTSWVYDGEGKNFLTTMLRLAKTREEVSIVCDQIGAPSYAPDIAQAILTVARNLVNDRSTTGCGVFHMTGAGETNWAEFARAIFSRSAAAGGHFAHVHPIATTDYPTAARRPANSRLNCDRLETIHGVKMQHWENALDRCMRDRTKRGEL